MTNLRSYTPVLLGVMLLAVGIVAGAVIATNSSSKSESQPKNVANEQRQIQKESTNMPEAKPVTVNMADWANYTNGRYNFSLRYPIGDKWELDELSDSNLQSLYRLSVTYDLDGSPDVAQVFVLEVYPKGKAVVTEQTLQKADQTNNSYSLNAAEKFSSGTLVGKKYRYKHALNDDQDISYYLYGDKQYDYVATANSSGSPATIGNDFSLLGQGIAQSLNFK